MQKSCGRMERLLASTQSRLLVIHGNVQFSIYSQFIYNLSNATTDSSYYEAIFFHIICTVDGYVLSSSFRYLMEYLFNQTLSDTCDGLHLCQKEPARSGLGAQDAARLRTQLQREFSGTEIPPTTFHV